MKKYFIMVMIIFLFILTGCSHSKKSTLVISAAASLQNALTEIKQGYEKDNPGIKLEFNFGGSGMLQKQIEQGAPVDLFISAGVVQMNALENNKLLLVDSRLNLLKNDLVLITSIGNTTIQSTDDILNSKVSIGIGNPETVPAGKYAKESLIYLNAWNKIQNQLIEGKDVEQVLTYVETGNVDCGFVYSSDANSSKVKIVETLPDDAHSPIIYPAAIINATHHKEKALDFLNYLQTEDAKQVFIKYGFKTV